MAFHPNQLWFTATGRLELMKARILLDHIGPGMRNTLMLQFQLGNFDKGGLAFREQSHFQGHAPPDSHNLFLYIPNVVGLHHWLAPHLISIWSTSCMTT